MSTPHASERTRLFLTLLIGICLLGANFLFSVLVLAGRTDEVVLGLVYLVARVGILFGSGAYLSARAARSRVQTIGLVSLLAFVDQVIWKGAWIWLQIRSGAPEWTGIPYSSIIWGILLGYFASIAVLILVALGAYEAGQAWKRRA